MKTALVALCLLFAVLYLIPLGIRPLNLPDETRYAEIPREMIAGNDWTVPRLCGARYFEKPPMGYWLTAVSISLFGENRFAVRLPSAIATGLSALLIGLLVRTTTGAAAPALWSVFIFLTMPFVFALGVVNVLDAPFSACVTAAVVFAFLATRETARRRRFALLAAAGAAAGFAFLIKGFLGFLLPAMAVCPFLVLERRWRDLLTAPWIPLGVAALVVMPWAVAVHIREPDYWRYFIMVEHVQRFVSPDKGQHPEPFWFLLKYLAGGPLLWTFLAPTLLRRLGGAWTGHRALILLSATWLAVPFLFFSVSSGKLPTYILPCFAPLAALLGIGAWRLADAPPDRLFRAGCAVSVLISGAALAYFVAGPFLPESARLYTAAEKTKMAVVCAAVAAWFVLSLFALLARNSERGLLFAGAAVVPVLLSLHVAIPAVSLHEKTPERILDECSALVSPRTRFLSDGYLAPAICWRFKTCKVSVTGTGELTYGLSFPEQQHRILTQEQLVARVADPDRPRDLAVVLFDRRVERLLPSMPKPDERRSADGISFLLFRRLDAASH